MVRFGRPRLITFDHPAYQQHVELMLLQRANQRAIRPPSQRDLFGGEAEEVVRTALTVRFDLSPRRILEYEERIGRHWHRRYRELDALVLGDRRVHVFEIKASRRAGALHRAMRQVHDTQAILELAFPTVAVTVVFVDTGVPTAAERDALASSLELPEQLPQPLDEAIALYPTVHKVANLHDLRIFPPRVELLVLNLDDIVSLADGKPLSLDWEEDEAVREEPETALPSSSLLYSSGDDATEDESPFAAALRKAAKLK